MRFESKLGYAIIAGIVGLSACSQLPDTPQKILAERLDAADRIVVTNPASGASRTLSNQEPKKIVQALRQSEGIGRDVSATLEYKLDFFKGTNHLATVPTSVHLFWIDKTPYHDKSGIVEQLYRNPF